MESTELATALQVQTLPALDAGSARRLEALVRRQRLESDAGGLGAVSTGWRTIHVVPDPAGRILASGAVLPLGPASRLGVSMILVDAGEVRGRGLGRQVFEQCLRTSSQATGRVAMLDATPAGEKRSTCSSTSRRPVAPLALGRRRGRRTRPLDRRRGAAHARGAAPLEHAWRPWHACPGPAAHRACWNTSSWHALAPRSCARPRPFVSCAPVAGATQIGPMLAQDELRAAALLARWLDTSPQARLHRCPDAPPRGAPATARRGFVRQRPFARMALGDARRHAAQTHSSSPSPARSSADPPAIPCALRASDAPARASVRQASRSRRIRSRSTPRAGSTRRRQRALTRYYLDAGAGGLAVGVHTTQFAIREARAVRAGAAARRREARSWQRLDRRGAEAAPRRRRLRPRPQQARRARRALARGLGYHAGLLSLAALKGARDGRAHRPLRGRRRRDPAGRLLPPAGGRRPRSAARVLARASPRSTTSSRSRSRRSTATARSTCPRPRRGARRGARRALHRQRRPHRARPGHAVRCRCATASR